MDELAVLLQGGDMEFWKYEGLGNDFIVVEGSAAASMTPELSRRLCDRHRGIGADGVLALVQGSPVAMRVYNADGTRPQMCGNGIRCVAHHLVRQGRVEEASPFVIETDAGPHLCTVSIASVEVEMRSPALLDPRWIDEPITEAAARFTAVTMGNPHAITFDAIAPTDRETTAGALACRSEFPEGVNVGFATMVDEQSMQLAVWERGVGPTEACGTGACAAGYAAVRTGRAKRGRPMVVSLPGGSLSITVFEEGRPVAMKGPARFVFRGQWEPDA